MKSFTIYLHSHYLELVTANRRVDKAGTDLHSQMSLMAHTPFTEVTYWWP